MKSLELINELSSLNDEEKLNFFIGDEKISNRFDREDIKQYQEGDYETKISYSLFSYILSAIIIKAKGKDRTIYGYSCFDTQLENLIKSFSNDIFHNDKVIKDDAMRTLNAFLFTNEDIKLNSLINKFMPLSTLNEIKKNPNDKRKLLKTYEKKTEIITNQVTLFVRSLYHSFLNKKDINAKDIMLYDEDYSIGTFIYKDKELIIPTWQNAFTLDSYKKVAIESLKSLPINLYNDLIDTISIIYMVKDIVVTTKFKETI